MLDYFVDIHTHNGKVEDDVVRMLNVTFGSSLSIAEQPISMGVHPWDVKEESVFDSLVLKNNAHQINCIGEIGLDKIKNEFWEKQLELFAKQLKLAMELEKPVIIHCVKAYNEVVQTLQKLNFNQVVIFHSFQSSIPMAKSLMDKGYYISFGKSLYESREKAIACLKSVPLDKVFFETDDNAYPIWELYKIAASNLQIPLTDLKQICGENYQRLFAI